MSDSKSDRGGSSSSTSVSLPLNLLQVTLVDDNARGHQSPNTFEIVEASMKKHSICALSANPRLAVCRWGNSDCTRKQRSVESSRKTDSSKSLPKRPIRRRARELATTLDTDSNHSNSSTDSTGSCSSSSGDTPLRLPSRQSSFQAQKSGPSSSPRAAFDSSNCPWRRTSSDPCSIGTTATKLEEEKEGIPPLMLWSRSYIASSPKAVKHPRFPSPDIRRRKQIFSQSA